MHICIIVYFHNFAIIYRIFKTLLLMVKTKIISWHTMKGNFPESAFQIHKIKLLIYLTTNEYISFNIKTPGINFIPPPKQQKNLSIEKSISPTNHTTQKQSYPRNR